MNTNTDRSGFVVSRDGSKINFLSMGSGPSVIVIPGALATASGYADFGRALAKHFSVHIIERRGRGLSAPQGEHYHMQVECDDVLALQQKIGAALLVGHSFGGLVALEAARHNPALQKIAVYEPGVSIGHSIAMDWIPAYEANLAANRPLDAFITYSLSTGPDRARRTPTLAHEAAAALLLERKRPTDHAQPSSAKSTRHREIARLDSCYQRYREISADVLLMRGGRTGIAWVLLAMERLTATLQRSEMKEFSALDHFGIDKKAPQEVADAIGAFLSPTSRVGAHRS